MFDKQEKKATAKEYGAISYDSGSGNGPFGLGWNLSIPSITRKNVMP